MYFVILAGGVGTRLWPRSRRQMPKQFLNITSPERTMLQETYARVEDMAPEDHFIVVTSRAYAPTVRAQLPRIPAENILSEPAGRGSAPAVGVSALFVHRKDPSAVMACLSADHFITHTEEFHRVLRVAEAAAKEGYLVTLGIQPSYAEIGYGYIQGGERLMEIDGVEVRRAVRFTEKPSLEDAQRFVAAGNFYWNAGMFIWQASTILDAFARYMPDLYERLMQIEAFWDETGKVGVIPEDIWLSIRSETIDYGIMEKADNVAVVPADLGWSDVGSWATLLDLLPASDDGENVVIGRHVGVDTRNSLIYSPDRLIATVGLENIVIVDTGDAILVCPKDRAQDVKRVVKYLEEQGLYDVL
ncbi:MAG: mannose-1-phosphate guanylyltransferase [Anaerolineae bacterium]|nr:mannose-1-phosphate guanylyltransferase [Anaerolineae bacterium]